MHTDPMEIGRYSRTRSSDVLWRFLNVLGHGLHEKTYENAILVELTSRERLVQQQQSFPVYYKGHQVGEYVPDLLVDDSVVVDAKVIDRIGDHEPGQMLTTFASRSDTLDSL